MEGINVMKQKRGSKYNDTISPNNSMNYIEYGIDEPLMNAFCSYVMSENTSVHKYGLTTLSKIVKDIKRLDLTKLDGLAEWFDDLLHKYQSYTGFSDIRINRLCILLNRQINKLKELQSLA